MNCVHVLAVRSLHGSYAAAWPAVVRDVQIIVDACAELGIVIAGPDGAGDPLIDTRTGITFNGDADTDEHHSRFTIPPPQPPACGWPARTLVHHTIDTAGQPYDLAVRTSMLRLRVLAGDCVVITSTAQYDTWSEAMTFYRRLFGPLPADQVRLLQLADNAKTEGQHGPVGQP